MTDEIDIYSDEWLAVANEELHTTKGCLRCGSRQATIRREIRRAPSTSFSLSGNNDRLESVAALILECPECGIKGYIRKNEEP